MMLSRRLFGHPLSVALLNSMRGYAMSRALEANVLSGLRAQSGTVETKPYSAAWLRMLVASFFLVRGPSHAFSQALTLWNASPDRASVALQRHLAFLYHLLRLPLWLGRIGKRALQHKRA
jgi:hypothetical protein